MRWMTLTAKVELREIVRRLVLPSRHPTETDDWAAQLCPNS